MFPVIPSSRKRASYREETDPEMSESGDNNRSSSIFYVGGENGSSGGILLARSLSLSRGKRANLFDECNYRIPS